MDSRQVTVLIDPPAGFQPETEVAACYVQAGDRLLLLQYADSGVWGAPAGKLEAGETPIQGLRRELREEIGLTLKPEHKLNEFAPLYVRKPEIDYIYHPFSIRLTDTPEIVLSPEHQAYRWVTVNEIGTLDLISGGTEVLQMFLGGDQ